MKIDAVIFDMDEVIIDSAKVANQLLLECAHKHGAQLSTLELNSLSGMSGKDFWTKVRDLYDISESVDNLLAEYDINEEIRRYSTLEPVEGVVDLIVNLNSKEYKLALATSAERIRMNAVLQQFDLGVYFKATVNSDEVLISKPDPQIFLLAADKLGVSPTNCLVIEDSQHGVEAAHRAGMKVVGYTGLLEDKSTLAAADYLINEFRDFDLSMILG